MTPIVDIIGAVVTTMIPTITGTVIVSGGGATLTIMDLPVSVTSCLYVSCKLKLNYSGTVIYGTIASISSGTVVVTLPVSKKVTPTSISVVLNYHYGHYQEIVNTFKEATHLETVKFEQFPAICLFQDIVEKHSTTTTEREASLHLLIITDTDRSFTAPTRYTNTFKPILIPLYELFMAKLECYGDVQITADNYDYAELLYFGKKGLYGNEGNIFNDFIDAIEINNLTIKTLKDV